MAPSPALTLVADIDPGAEHLFRPANLLNVNGTLFFSAAPEASGNELWKSDGTNEGTTPGQRHPARRLPTPIQSISSISAGCCSSPPMTAQPGPSYGKAMHRAGHHPLVDLNPGTASSNPANFFEHNGVLFFVANDGAAGPNCGKPMAPPPAPRARRGIYPGTDSSNAEQSRQPGASCSSPPMTAPPAVELWKTDGTAPGDDPGHRPQSGPRQRQRPVT